MKKKGTLPPKDLEDWNKYIENHIDIFDKDLLKNKSNKIDSYKFDLHGCALEEANNRVKNVINNCIKRKIYKVIFITGKGLHSKTDENVYTSNTLSKLKYSVPDYIKTNPEISELVQSIETAPNKEGGDGAIVIKLKKATR